MSDFRSQKIAPGGKFFQNKPKLPELLSFLSLEKKQISMGFSLDFPAGKLKNTGSEKCGQSIYQISPNSLIHGPSYAKRSLMPWVIVIPKGGLARVAVPPFFWYDTDF